MSGVVGMRAGVGDRVCVCVVGDRLGGALEQDAVELGPQRPRQQPAACVCARA